MAWATDIAPEGEALRRALYWLDDRVREEPQLDRVRLVGEASLRFDLTPAEEQFLLDAWSRSPAGRS
jgi:hypothetical protein